MDWIASSKSSKSSSLLRVTCLGKRITFYKDKFSSRPVFVPCPDSHALPIQAAVIKPSKSTSSPHRNSLDIIPVIVWLEYDPWLSILSILPVPVIDWVPPLEHDLPLLDVQLPPPAPSIIIDHSTQVIRHRNTFRPK